MPNQAAGPPQCRGKNAEGKPCGATTQVGRAWCMWHDPEREAERAEWRAQGGRARSHRSTAARELRKYATDMNSLRGTLFLTLKRVSDGELEPSVGNSMATIARAIVAVSQATDLEERLTRPRATGGNSRRRMSSPVRRLTALEQRLRPDILPLRYFLEPII